MSQKTWGGRFSGGTDNRVEAFTESISFDRRLYRHDIRASQAHARMLAEVGLLAADEADRIVHTLDDIAGEIDRGEFAFSVALEDIHTHIERALIERLGDVGRRLHTGRSRNDQVVTDVRLWVRDAIDRLDGRLRVIASGSPIAASESTSCRWGPRPLPVHRYRLTAIAFAGSSASTPSPPTAWTRRRTGISSWNSSSTCHCLPCT